MLEKIPWWMYVIVAGLAWGVYVPLVFFGGQMLTGDPKGLAGRLASILCVGGAYFVLAILIPLGLMAVLGESPSWKVPGIVFASLAGVAGAVGAICVIFASKAAVSQAILDKVDPATFRSYIAPLIFTIAPVVNTLLSLVWHPNKDTGEWAVFHMPDWAMIGWKLPVGIVLVAAGTFLVLMSKEDYEKAKTAKEKLEKGAGPAAVTPAVSVEPAALPAGS